MEPLIFDVNSHHALDLGYQYDHNVRTIKFEGFTPIDSTNTIYLKYDGLGLYPLFDMSFTVSSSFVMEPGTFKGQLVEIKESDDAEEEESESSDTTTSTESEDDVEEDKTLVQHSRVFSMMVRPSLYADGEIVDEDPNIDLWFDQMSELYQTVNSKLTNGEFVGNSAYEVAVENGFTGTEDEWLSSLKATITSENISTALGYVPADEDDIPTVPDNVSAFTNDSGYLIMNDIVNKAEKSEVGNLSNLKTTNKSNLVEATNEIIEEMVIYDDVDSSSPVPTPTLNTLVSNITGDLSELNTVAKGTIVASINEISDDLSTKITKPSGAYDWQVLVSVGGKEEWRFLNGRTDVVNSINGESGDITLTADSIGAISNTITHLSGDIAVSEKGAPGGVATLDYTGMIPSSQLPAFVDDVLEYTSKNYFPPEGESGKIYIDLYTNKTWRWSGSVYTEISPSIALGETSSTAYPGDKGKEVTARLNNHLANTINHITDAERILWNSKSDFDGYYGNLEGLPLLGTASAKDIAVSGNAGTDQVVMGNDSRLSDARPAIDVFGWAKSESKPVYTPEEIGAMSADVIIPNKTSDLTNDSGFVTDISGKTDKVSSAVNGHFAGLDSYGNLVDSGHKHSDYITTPSTGSVGQFLKKTETGVEWADNNGLEALGLYIDEDGDICQMED